MNELAIHAHRLLLRTGLSLAHVFAWIFVFEYLYILSGSVLRAFAGLLLLYATTQLVTVVATPVAAQHLGRGVKHSLIWGVALAAGAFVFLGGSMVGYFNNPPAWGLVIFAVLLGAYRALYWVPYQLVVAEEKPHLHMRAYFEVLIALMPLFAGLTIGTVAFGHLQLLFGASALLFLSALPVLFLSDTRERFSWPLHYTFAQLWRQKNRGLVLHSILEGLQGAALFLVWPLAIFLILEWSYFGLGLVFSLTLLLVLLFRRLYGWGMKRFSLQRSATVHAIVATSGWIARFAAGTPIGIVVADVYAHTTLPRQGAHVDPFAFEQASDRGAFLDEYTALKEIGLGIGRIMLSAMLFFLALAFTLPVVLAIGIGIAAASSGIAVLIAHRMPSAAY